MLVRAVLLLLLASPLIILILDPKRPPTIWSALTGPIVFVAVVLVMPFRRRRNGSDFGAAPKAKDDADG